MAGDYPPGVTESMIGADRFNGDPEDATHNDATFDEWNAWIEPSLDYDDEELMELYSDGKTPREVNGGAA
jgi:hypothetical protein